MAGLAALDLTARGTCGLGCMAGAGAEASDTPSFGCSAGLVGLRDELLSGSTPCGGAAETASGLGAHLFRLFASPTGRLGMLVSVEDASGQPPGGPLPS